MRKGYRIVLVMILAAAVIGVGVRAVAGGHGIRRAGQRAKHRVSSEEVALVPPHYAGVGGWCLRVLRRGGTAAGCWTKERLVTARRPLGPFTGPIIAASASSNSIFVARGGGSTVVDVGLLVAPQVAAVAVGAHSWIATRGNTLLPDHLRGAIVRVRSGKLLPQLRIDDFAARNKTGKRLTSTGVLGMPLAFEVGAREWGHGEREPRGVCSLRVHGKSGLIFQSGSVMTQAVPHPDVRGREFVDCMHSVYMDGNGHPIEANILLDAAHPGATPAALPGMKALRGHPGIYVGPGPADQELARRARGAWLLVGEGESVDNRLAFLEHAHVMLRMP